ncbi:MAG: hypothetical protein AMXMBFR58_26200 [Phycisphaerae bacterium]
MPSKQFRRAVQELFAALGGGQAGHRSILAKANKHSSAIDSSPPVWLLPRPADGSPDRATKGDRPLKAGGVGCQRRSRWKVVRQPHMDFRRLARETGERNQQEASGAAPAW